MIGKEEKVAAVFERYPKTQVVFAQFGFHALLNPLLRKTFGRVTSIERGCRLHRVPLEPFLKALNQAVQIDPTGTESAVYPSGASSALSLPPKDANPAAREILEANVGVLTREHPEVKAVFIKHFGPGCFECPSFGAETVIFACSMHQTDPATFGRECLNLLRRTKTRP